jgi:hypothetical protein
VGHTYGGHDGGETPDAVPDACHTRKHAISTPVFVGHQGGRPAHCHLDRASRKSGS